MSTELETHVIQTLQSLSERIAQVIADGKSQGLLRSSKGTYAIDRIDAVEETEHGIKRRQWETEFITKETWYEAASIVVWRIKEAQEYQDAFQMLKDSGQNEYDAESILKRFSSDLSYKCLETEDESQRAEKLQDLFGIVRKHLNNEPFVCSSKVMLLGVAAPTNAAKFNIDGTEILLRQLTKDDLKREEYYTGFREQFPEDPSAILRIQLSGTSPNELNDKVHQAITILRLFKVGSVTFKNFTTESESLTGMFGGIGGHMFKYATPYHSVIKDEDVAKLEKFWEEMSKVLPTRGYWIDRSNNDPIEIAYQRYSDAVLLYGTTERRIADSVMGLESLFLRGSENQELNYRLRMRVAKVLGLLGHDPYPTKKVVNDAYTVRSAFVHGDVVQDKIKRGIENRHESLTKLLETILNLLRISIVASAITRGDKENLISLIDDSFIDNSKLAELERLLEPVQPMI